MKFRVERDLLADAVSWVARSLPARPTLALQSGLMMTVGDAGGLVLSGSDYDVSARAEIDAAIEEPGAALVAGRMLAEITRSLPAAPVTVSSEGSRMELRCGRSSFLLPTMSAQDYPSLPSMPGTAGSVPGALFAHAVAQVAIAASRDEAIPFLTGVRIEIDDHIVTLAATDRYRLAIREFAWAPERPGGQGLALVPARTLAESAKALASCDTVEIALAAAGEGEGIMGFQGGGRRTTTRLLDGEFPKYRALLPTEVSAVATISTATLVDALKRVSLVAGRHIPVRMSFTPDVVDLAVGGISSGSPEDASASEQLDVRLDGDPIEIAFNPHFLLDGLSAIGSDTAQISFVAPGKPAVLTAASADPDTAGDVSPAPSATSDERDSYRYLLMPVRLAV